MFLSNSAVTDLLKGAIDCSSDIFCHDRSFCLISQIPLCDLPMSELTTSRGSMHSESADPESGVDGMHSKQSLSRH
jgi:hypothetical protein